jgi:hypothetical protein
LTRPTGVKRNNFRGHKCTRNQGPKACWPERRRHLAQRLDLRALRAPSPPAILSGVGYHRSASPPAHALLSHHIDRVGGAGVVTRLQFVRRSVERKAMEQRSPWRRTRALRSEALLSCPSCFGRPFPSGYIPLYIAVAKKSGPRRTHSPFRRGPVWPESASRAWELGGKLLAISSLCSPGSSARRTPLSMS